MLREPKEVNRDEERDNEIDSDPFSPSFKSTSFFHNGYSIVADLSPLDGPSTPCAASIDILSAEMLASTLFHTLETLGDGTTRTRRGTHSRSQSAASRTTTGDEPASL
jgi:hypothetical protein